MAETIEKFAPGIAFTTASESPIEWLVHHSHQRPAEGQMTLTEKFFSPDYFTARDRFRKLVPAVGGLLETLAIDAKGPKGENLGIDIAWFGAPTPRRVLLHSSGLHGVEGFAGSAIQLQLLNEVPVLPKDVAVILVHILNPYGMSWLRRTNENNVDLNRNFLKDDDYTDDLQGMAKETIQTLWRHCELSGLNPQEVIGLYAKFNSFLNPPSRPSWDLYSLKAARLILQYGMPMLKQAVVGGQYSYPRGLFFGGKSLQQGPRQYQSFLTRRLASAEHLVTIDVHTGLGPYGDDTLLAEPTETAKYETLQRWFGSRMAPFDPKRSPAYFIRGGLDAAAPRFIPKTLVHSVTQEFGTYSGTKVLQALRQENRWHHYGDGRLDHPTKHILKKTFYPQDETWQKRVLQRGKELLEQGLSNL
jgi:hypothetical protein